PEPVWRHFLGNGGTCAASGEGVRQRENPVRHRRPVDGEDTYRSYAGMIELLRRELSAHEFDDVFRGNALRLFGVEV
ncbi:MAG TPA: hypothetical protein PLI62_19370, partial [Spirochaetota bacterium]|nr:hypothetical protein [Spirochaetota bacterium]